MNLLLTARSGFTKGASWVLSESPLVIGRGNGCNIVIEERSVSRQHCEICREGNAVRLRDVGSRNPTLVNGEPATDTLLNVGDEFMVGPATFLIAATSLKIDPEVAHDAGDEAISTAITETGLFSDEETPGTNRSWIGDPDDYPALFRFGRQLSLCETSEKLLECVATFFEKRFQSDDYIVARKNGPRWASVYPKDEEFPSDLPRWFARARTHERTYYARGTDDTPTYLVAPLRCGPIELGVCALRVSAVDGVRVKMDIAAYTAACEILGPYLSNIERIERLAAVNARLVDAHETTMGLIGASRAIQDLRLKILNVAPTDMNVLLLGETGTGKELAARAIHDASERRSHRYIVVNCAAFTDELFESEFFGHARGAFTGATGEKQGLVEIARGGTLVLDEVGELSAASQAKLLRVVEQRTFRRIGEESERSADIRIIAASNRALNSNGFRKDLYHRLGGVIIEIPPLRHRKSDIPILAQFFLDRLLARRPGLHRALDQDAYDALMECNWPGNVRELKNVVERSAQISKTEILGAADLSGIGSTNDESSAPELRSLANLERDHIAHVLDSCGWNVSKASRILSISRSTLYQKIGEYGLRDALS